MPDEEKRRARETGDDAQAISFLKRLTAFNAAQCENLPDDIAIVAPPPLPGLIEPQVEALIRATGIDVRIGGNRAFYVPALDYVQVPPPQGLFRADQLAPHGAARARSRDGPSFPTRPRYDRRLRHQEVCVRGADRRNERRILLRVSPHRADRAARGLYRPLRHPRG